jgi:activating signal cointegrator complex subunit 3
VQHRKELVELVHKAISILKSDKAGPGPQSRMPSYGTQVFILSTCT